MLIWIEKPTDAQCKRASVGPKKWFCGRKKKFGIALQGTCDVEGRFLDVVMEHPASTSDFLAFTTSPLYHQMEVKGFLAPGLCLFGDNAYVNCHYMATPFRSSAVGTAEDNYNYFHSQLRIRIECAFGMLVGRWGLLRRALPSTLSLRKVTALVMCLCKLHNFLINKRIERQAQVASKSRRKPSKGRVGSASSDAVDELLAADSLELVAHGGVPLEQRDSALVPMQLMDGGHHHEDTTESYRRQFMRRSLGPHGRLPRDRLRDQTLQGQFERPLPATWK